MSLRVVTKLTLSCKQLEGMLRCKARCLTPEHIVFLFTYTSLLSSEIPIVFT